MRETRNGRTRPWQPDAGLLEALPVATVAMDVRGRVRYVNEAAKAFFGVNGDGLLNESASTALFAETEEGAIAEILGLS